MRSVSVAALVKAQAADGVEAQVMLELDTGNGLIYFADRDTGSAEGRIISLSNINLSESGSVAVELSDHDDYFLNLLCSTRFEGRTARVIQLLDSEQVELFVGRVSSPITWEEQKRTFRFDIAAFYRASDNEVPFTPEEDSGLAEKAWGKTWPRVFGFPIDVPAIQVIFPPRGTLIAEFRPTQGYFDIEVPDDVDFPIGSEITVQVGNEYVTGIFEQLESDPVTVLRFHVASRNVSKGTIFSVDRTRLTEIEEPPPGFQKSWESDPRYAAWDTNGQLLAGNWLWLIDAPDQIGAGQVNTAEYVSNNLQGNYSVPSFVGNKNYILYQKGDATRGQLPWFGPGGLLFLGVGGKAEIRGVLDVNDTLWPAGTPVEQVIEVTYVVSDKPVDALYRVRAWREVKIDERGGRKRELVTLPEDFYTVVLNDTVAGHECTTVTLRQSLGSRNSGWDDTLFVTAKRGDGNIAGIIEELLTEAGMTVDTGTVEDDCEPYPMSFAVLDRTDAVSLAKEIAWQGRCAIGLYSTVATLTYLSKEPTSFAFSYQDENLIEDSLQLTTSETGEVENDIWFRWRKRYSQGELNKIHRKSEDSIESYGRKKAEYEIWAYRRKSLVLKTVEFWFNRKSRLWRKMRLVSDLDAIQLTPYDYAQSLLNELQTVGLIETVEHNTEECTIATFMWTPVEVGSCDQSEFAYLDDSGDTRPDDPTITAGDIVEEVIEVSPIDLGLSTPEGHVGEVTADEIDKIFNAKLYKGNENTGEVVETSVQVRNITDTPVKAGNVVTVFKAEDGTYYSGPGGSSSVFWGQVTAFASHHATCNLFRVTDDASTLELTGVTVLIISGTPQVGDILTVYKSGITYWAQAGVGIPPMGMAIVTSDAADKTAIPARLYQGNDFSGSGTAISVAIPALQTTAKVPAGTWMVVMRFGDAWVGYIPLIMPRVPA